MYFLEDLPQQQDDGRKAAYQNEHDYIDCGNTESRLKRYCTPRVVAGNKYHKENGNCEGNDDADDDGGSLCFRIVFHNAPLNE